MDLQQPIDWSAAELRACPVCCGRVRRVLSVDPIAGVDYEGSIGSAYAPCTCCRGSGLVRVLPSGAFMPVPLC